MLADPRHSRVVLINPSRGKPAAVSAEFAARWTESLSLLEAVHDIFDVGVNVIGEHDPAQWSKLLVSTIKPLDGDGLSLWREERFTATISTSDAGIIFIGGVWLDEEVFITALQGVRLGYDVRLLADLSICRIEADRSLVLDRLAAHGVLTTTLRQALLEWAVCLDDPMLTKRVRELLP